MKGLFLMSWKTRVASVGFLLLVPSLCAAQSARASDRHLEGIVLDQQALPIPGVQKEFGANPALVGNFLPQVPAHRGSVQVAYANPKYFTVAAGLQFLGRQFDDDLNVRVVPAAALAEAGYATSTAPGLPKYAVVDLMASRAVGKNLDVFFGVQNLFDQAYFVQTSPSTIGTPRLVSGGVRVRFMGR